MKNPVLLVAFTMIMLCNPACKEGEQSYSIGQAYGGGIIFYIDDTQQHGLVAAPEDQAMRIPWSNAYTLTGATDTAIGTGSVNTTQIIAVLGNSGDYAAKVCKDYQGGGYDDWFLPSRDEMNLMYLNLKVNNLGGDFTTTSYYWCSTEIDESSAWIISMSSGYWYPEGGSKTSGINAGVRAVRAF